MGIFTTNKKDKEPPEPQYYRSATNMETYNYKVYYMSTLEKLLYGIGSFVLGALVGYLFYGGIGKDEFNQPTTLTYVVDIVISSICGLIATNIIVPAIRKNLVANQKKKLRFQFRDMLEAVSASLGAGNNVIGSFQNAYMDLKVQYDDDSYILKEMRIILSGLENNIRIEDLLSDFGQRSGIDDIQSFAEVFEVCYRKGGNIRETVRTSFDIISDKMAINDEIETVIAGSKLDQNIMIVLPVVLIALIKSMSPDFAKNFTTPTGIISTTIALAIFVGSYALGRVLMNIKV